RRRLPRPRTVASTRFLPRSRRPPGGQPPPTPSTLAPPHPSGRHEAIGHPRHRSSRESRAPGDGPGREGPAHLEQAESLELGRAQAEALGNGIAEDRALALRLGHRAFDRRQQGRAALTGQTFALSLYPAIRTL